MDLCTFAIMIRKLTVTCCFTFCLIAKILASPIDSVFVRVPTDILPMLDKNARLDMIDLYNYNMKAEAYNIYGGKSVMTQKTDSMFSISLTESSRWDLALLPQSADTIFAVIYTILSPAESSRIVLYDADWQPLAYQFQLPEIEKFFREPYSFSPERMEILKQNLKMCSVSLSFSPQTRALIAKVSTTNAPEDDLADLKHLLFPLRYVWTGDAFQLSPSSE